MKHALAEKMSDSRGGGRFAFTDWNAIYEQLDAFGYAVLDSELSREECRILRSYTPRTMHSAAGSS